MAEPKMVDGWEVLFEPPSKDEKGQPIPLARQSPWRLRYKGIEGIYSPAGVVIVWPEKPDLHKLCLPTDKARPIIDYYLGDRLDWPFSWMKIVPVEKRQAMQSRAQEVIEAPQEAVPAAVVPPPQPLLAEVPETKSVTTPKKLTAKQQAKLNAYNAMMHEQKQRA